MLNHADYHAARSQPDRRPRSARRIALAARAAARPERRARPRGR